MTDSHPIIDDTFRVHSVLGVGYTSKVLLAEHIDTGFKLAIKIFKPIRPYNILLDGFNKEIDLMKNLRHENLINIIAANHSGVMIDNNKKESIMYIGVELAENAELFDFIADPGKEFNENIARKFFRQLIEGVKSMHGNCIAHRDLKTENLFLDKDFNLKIGDFGFSKMMNTNENNGKLKTCLGTTGYQSPELLEGGLYEGEDNDVFALGVILFILTKAYPPFREARKNDSWYRHIYFEKYENFWVSHSKRGQVLSKELIDLITGMIRYKNRFKINDILNSSWMKGEVTSDSEFLVDMTNRKKYVDARRQKEIQETYSVNTNQGTGTGTGMVYRGENEDVLIGRILEDLNLKGVDSFPVNEWENHRSRYILRFDGEMVKDVFIDFIKILIKEKGKVETSEKDYSLIGEVPYFKDEEEYICKFCAILYIDYSKSQVVIELLKDMESDAFVFNEFVDFIIERYLK